jgi:hypothetical protein
MALRTLAAAAALTVALGAAASAQVIECPGALPVTDIKPDRTGATAERLLGRFVSALGLRGIPPVDEAAIMAAYREQPDQLLVKLQYLALQCTMLVLDGSLALPERQSVVRRVFLDYVLAPPRPEERDLAAYLNKAASGGTGEGASAEATSAALSVENARQRSEREQWHQRWYRPPSDSVDDSNRWSVIVASPDGENQGWEYLREHQTRWPQVHFELHAPYDFDSRNYAIIAGRRLPEASARELAEEVKRMGMASDAFAWPLPVNGDVDQLARIDG